MSLVNLNDAMLPLTNGIDNILVDAFARYLQSKTLINSPFMDTVFNFYRFDVPSSELPAILISYAEPSTRQQDYWQIGYLKMDVLFPSNMVKDLKLQSAANIFNWVEILMMQDVISVMQTFYPILYSLWFFGINNTKNDTTTLTKNNVDLSKATMKIDYKINLQAWYAWLLSHGYDLSSPDTVIYQPVRKQDITLQITPIA